jgi:molybdopterin-guanine dinucleotide biosynthesis protein A
MIKPSVTDHAAHPVLVGILVGGKGLRMGKMAKGLLPVEDGRSVVRRLLDVIAEALDEPDVVLVGRAKDYSTFGLEQLADDPSGVGPLGGISALMGEALRRGCPQAIALACDLPYVTPALLHRLASFASEARAVAPRAGDFWQPLFARYAPEATAAAVRSALAARQHALYKLLEPLDPAELPLDEPERDLLIDWDTADDVQRGKPSTHTG